MNQAISDISYIIGFSASNSEREAALFFVLQKLRIYFPEMELSVIEQDTKSRLTIDANLRVQHIFAYNPGLYNRCWAFNIGVKHTSKSAFVFADADVFLSKKDYTTCFKALAEFEAITPNKISAINVKIANPEKLEFTAINKRPLYTFAGGLLLLTRDAYLKIGGWDERFEGWGCEDEALSHVIYNTLISKSFNFPLYHIDHPRSAVDGKQQIKYRSNKILMEEILMMNGIVLTSYIQKLKKSEPGNLQKYKVSNIVLPDDSPQLKNRKFVFAVTTFNRLANLKACIHSFLKTRNPNINWTLIIADDGSTDGTLDFLKELQHQHNTIIIYNQNVQIHHQVNTLLKQLATMDFDLCFQCDDDIHFLKKGWDTIYWETIQRTGFQHLIHYDKSWRPYLNMDRPVAFGQLVAYCQAENIQGAFYTITPDIIRQVGYFDEQRFGKRGHGHIDFSFRCCRAGFNALQHPFDIQNSNDYIQLQTQDTQQPSLRMQHKSKVNSKEITIYKQKLMRTNRQYIPYNENFQTGTRKKEEVLVVPLKKRKPGYVESLKKADATFYPERGIAGFFGFLLKRFYNFCIDWKIYFISRAIKAFGKFLNKLSIDLMNIDD